ncbi:MAG: FlgD immunoglobulin-like domain containing protein [Candidatus Eiseniibacteriota bacterium]
MPNHWMFPAGLRGRATRIALLPPARVLAALLSTLLSPALAFSASVHPLFSLSSLESCPFPSDRFTLPDPTQITGLHVALPQPDCATRPSDCSDLDVLNELDGFNLLPRLSIPFDGPIDPTTATSHNIFLVNLGSTLGDVDPSGHVVGIDQVVWDPTRKTLYVESDELLEQHTRYVLVVTKDLRDPEGKEIKAGREFLQFADDTRIASAGDPELDAYRASVLNALSELDSRGIVPRGQVVAASVFTTLSVSANLEKMRDAVHSATPAPADFLLGTGGSRTVFPRSLVNVIAFGRQMSTNPAEPLSFVNLAGGAIDAVPGAVGRIAFGRFTSPDYRVHPGEFIPQVGTLTGNPVAQGSSEITFMLWLPSGPAPAAGYPVAIYGHGGGTNKTASGLFAAKLAESGIATIAIDGPGVGFGSLSVFRLSLTDGTSVTLLSGGRSLDQNGDGRIVDGEGADPAPPRAMLGSGRGDWNRQRAIDHMQLVRVIEVGMDVDGDGVADLDPSRIYYFGQSAGGRQGAIFLAVEPSVRAGVLNVPSSSVDDRLSSGRNSVGVGLQSRVPSLINSPGVTSVDGIAIGAPRFNENLPLREGAPFGVVLQDGSSQTVRSPVVNTVAGAIEIQEALERAEWAHQLASSPAFASYLRRRPLAGVPAKAVIVQFPYGDRAVVNPGTSSLLRAAELADRATFFRTDLAFETNPTPFPGNPNLYPHAFLQFFANDATLSAYGLAAQGQIASFFALDGPDHILDPWDATQITDPDLDGPIFEVPIVPPLPTRLNYPLSGSLAAQSIDPPSLHDNIEPAQQARWSFSLERAVPNPVAGDVQIHYTLAAPTSAHLRVYDVAGRLVKDLVDGPETAGPHDVVWDGRTDAGRKVPAGIYFYRLDAGGWHGENKLIVVAP